MSRIPQGCRTLGGTRAEGVNRCRDIFFNTFFSRGYMAFLPSGIQLMESVWEKYPPEFRSRLVALTSPRGEPCLLMGDPTLAALAYMSAHHAPHERPLRLCYAQKVYRQGEDEDAEGSFETFQVGGELLGWNGHGAEVEMLSLIMESFDALGIEGAAAALGDVALLKHLGKALSDQEEKAFLRALQSSSYREYDATIASFRLAREEKRFFHALPHLKGGPEVLEEAESISPGLPLEELKEIITSLEAMGYGENIRVDLGLFREIGYYSGPVFNIYLPREGRSLGGGGRYDGLLSEYGMVGQALGFNLDLERMAQSLSLGNTLRTVMVWGGAAAPQQALSYAREMVRTGARTEMSWHEDAAASRDLAGIRKYRWWLNGSTGELFDLEHPGKDPEKAAQWLKEGLSC